MPIVESGRRIMVAINSRGECIARQAFDPDTELDAVEDALWRHLNRVDPTPALAIVP